MCRPYPDFDLCSDVEVSVKLWPNDYHLQEVCTIYCARFVVYICVRDSRGFVSKRLSMLLDSVDTQYICNAVLSGEGLNVADHV
jgi:hypothetical protein